jgi:AraC-like DNA-binding protein
VKGSIRRAPGARALPDGPLALRAATRVSGPQPPAGWAPILRRLVQGANLRRPPATWSLACERPCSGWIETHVDPRSYSWDGLKRATGTRDPWAIFQLTLAGFGELDLPGRGPQALPAGTAFLVLVPSAHCYYLPPRSTGWTFGWFDVHHPYVVERIARHIDAHGPILHLSPGDAFTAVAVRLIDRVIRREFPDAFAVEGALFEFVVACDRFAHHTQYPAAQRERLLEQTRDVVLADPRRPLRVDVLAAERGMSRSNFSHYFKARTGLTPAAFATGVRIREAARMLLSTQAPLKEIADTLGFANVNHFCKVFRRHQHTSPAAYRRQQ